MTQLRLDGGEAPPGPAAATTTDEPRRGPRLVELNTADYARATAYADACAGNIAHGQLTKHLDDEVDADRGERDDELVWHHYNLGGQGEIAAARVLGVLAPLDPRSFRAPDIPPYWSVKTQLGSSTDSRRGYLRLRRRSMRPRRRHVYVERDVHLRGGYVFVVHGFVTTERALDVGRRLYGYSENVHVHVRYLEPIEPLCELDVERLERIAERCNYQPPRET